MEYKIIEASLEDSEMLLEKIQEFNAEKLGLSDDVEQEICYILKNENDTMLGGIKANFYFGQCLYIDVLWVKKSQRSQGIGSSLLKFIENKALDLGAKLIHISTFDFQAKDFYIKHGYEIFGILENCPEGHKRYYMKKDLL